ncbi:hypothetical protein BAE44_0004854 [Dichanthelium oligosanthes]|uniref:Uncharacterized protein n=1 Tax=Dichanthelium oligosanthes TaxID=888268 RepID=A0A1E5W9U6_9POAL|nr:hypothetical protein BAE44_0004854 [Dichanthelium oligosanthes]
MITRAKLVEQLREHQIRSAQSYSAALAVFSPSPHIASRLGLPSNLLTYDFQFGALGAYWSAWMRNYGTISYAKSVDHVDGYAMMPHKSSRRDLKVALICAVLFCFLMVSCYIALYLKWFKLSAMFVIFGILLPVTLKISRNRRLKRKRERRLLLPLSM